jgi:hypothetical protein
MNAYFQGESRGRGPLQQRHGIGECWGASACDPKENAQPRGSKPDGGTGELKTHPLPRAGIVRGGKGRGVVSIPYRRNPSQNKKATT